MSSGYKIIVNVFGDSATGHVNVTFVAPNGTAWAPQTYGNNVNGGLWGVRDEASSLDRGPAQTEWDVSYEQFMSAYGMVQNFINGPDNNYGLFGQNCVDFVRAVLETAGLGNQVASLFQDLGLAVNAYAHVTDWLISNGFGGIASSIGGFLGNAGELGNAVVDIASWAFSEFSGSMVDAAWEFVSGLGSAVGGFSGDLFGIIRDFFRPIKDNLPGDGEMETEGRSYDPDGGFDDFVPLTLVDGPASASAAPALQFEDVLSPWGQLDAVAPQEVYVEPMPVDILPVVYPDSGDWLFA